MPYDDLDQSVADGRPFELFEFTRGTWAAYLTTRAEDFVATPAITFENSPIKRSKIGSGQDALKDPITITLPRGNSLAREFINIPPEQTTSITIRRCLDGLTYAESVVSWKGRIRGATTSGESVELSCDSIFTSIQQNGLREKMEYVCQAALYSPACGVDQPSYRYDDTIGVVSGTAITMSAASAFADGYFTGGIIQFVNDSRFIISHVGNLLIISRPLSVLVAGIEVALYPGCNHILTGHCKTRYANTLRFRGFPFIPNRNPFQGAID